MTSSNTGTTSHKMMLVLAALLTWMPLTASAQTTPAQATPPQDSSSAHAGSVVEPEALAQDTSSTVELSPALEKRARSLNEQLRCPVCQSSSIEESPAFEATEMKSVVRTMLAEGKSDEEIIAYFQSRYGDWVMLAPPKRGFNLLVYVLPLLLVVGGAVFVYRTARRWVSSPAA